LTPPEAMIRKNPTERTIKKMIDHALNSWRRHTCNRTTSTLESVIFLHSLTLMGKVWSLGGKDRVTIDSKPCQKIFGGNKVLGGKFPPRDVWINHWLEY
jgi:hypothetical protein